MRSERVAKFNQFLRIEEQLGRMRSLRAIGIWTLTLNSDTSIS